jgi:NAD(P)-dependent dehydrogenase (short-subunit alcohol dehydrogenase family)
MSSTGTILLIGASRGLGLGLAAEYLARGWHVVATARDPARADGLTALHAAHPGELTIEKFDIEKSGGPASMTRAGAFDVIFFVAGVSGHSHAPIHAVPPGDAAREFLVNAYHPVSLAEALMPALRPGGTVVFMTSILGSLALNTHGDVELYRASKAALNMLTLSFATRHRDLPILLMHPGWVRTDMGGSRAPLDVPTSTHGMADTIAARGGKPGVSFLGYDGEALPW